MTTRAWLLLLVATLAGCSGEAEQHDFVDFGIEVESADGLEATIACEPLPLLGGSRRYTEHVIDKKFSITVFTSPEQAQITFKQGSRSIAQGLLVSREMLEQSNYDETILLTLLDGSRYTVTVTSECTP